MKFSKEIKQRVVYGVISAMTLGHVISPTAEARVANPPEARLSVNEICNRPGFKYPALWVDFTDKAGSRKNIVFSVSDGSNTGLVNTASPGVDHPVHANFIMADFINPQDQIQHFENGQKISVSAYGIPNEEVRTYALQVNNPISQLPDESQKIAQVELRVNCTLPLFSPIP